MESKLVPGICTQCQSVLQLNPDQDAAICPSCGTPFIVEKAINQYNITAQGSLTISNSVFQMGPSAENMAKRGFQFLELKQYDKANEYFNKALDIDVDCKEAIEGMAKLKEEQIQAQNLVLLESAKREEAQLRFRHAWECFQELCRRDPDNEEYAEGLIRTTERYQNFSYIAEPVWYLGTFFPTPGVLHLTSQKLLFVPRDAGKKSFTLSMTDFVGISAVREGSNGNGKLILLKVFYKENGQNKNVYFRTEKAYDIATRIHAYIQNGFD